MKTNKFKVVRNSKAIYTVNGVRIDTRKRVNKKAIKFKGARQALNIYFQLRNPDLYWEKIDQRVCFLMNRNLKAFEALDYQTVFAK